MTWKTIRFPNLEVARFGFYVFFPIAMMFHYGNPEWFDEHVIPARDRFFPPIESTNKPPTDPHDIKNEIARMKAERLARRAAKEAGEETVPAGASSTGRLV